VVDGVQEQGPRAFYSTYVLTSTSHVPEIASLTSHNFTSPVAVPWLRVHCNMSSEFGKFLLLPEERDSSAPPRRRYCGRYWLDCREVGGGAAASGPGFSQTTPPFLRVLQSQPYVNHNQIQTQTQTQTTIPITTLLPALFLIKQLPQEVDVKVFQLQTTSLIIDLNCQNGFYCRKGKSRC
jgi:hypothetical protein